MKDTLSTLPAGILTASVAAQVSKVDVPARLSLRARGDLSVLGKALGIDLPSKIGTIAKKSGVEIICLGPDEWTILAPDASPVVAACKSVYATLPHSLTDISAREVTLKIEGPKATTLIEIGCPRDPASIAIGAGRRTVFDGQSVVLWRDGENSYRMDIWNSFASHLLHFMEVACRELATEV